MDQSREQSTKRQILESLPSNPERFSVIHEVIRDIIFDLEVVGEDHYVLKFVNKVLDEAVDIDKGQIIGKSLKELIPGHLLPGLLDKFREAIRTKSLIKWEQRINFPKKAIYGEFQIIPVINNEGICKNLVGSFHDVTEWKNAEEQMRMSEERWKTYMTKSPDGIVITSIAGIVEEATPKTLKMFGYHKKADVIGKILFDFIDPAYHEKGLNHIKTIIEGGETDAEQYLAYRKDGSSMFVEVNTELIRNSQGEPVNLIHIVRDITRRKTIENTLIEREAEYHRLYQMIRLMSDTMPDMMWAKDLEKNYIFANKAICEILLNAKSTSEPIGKNDLFFAERERNSRPDDPEWHSFGEICMDTDDTTLKELKQMQFDEFGNVKGKFIYLDVHKAPLFNHDGKLIGIVGSGRDITERKQSEKTISMLAQAIRSVSECVSITDMSDRIIYVNNAFLKIYGYEEQELLGRQIQMVRSPQNCDEYVKDILPATLKGGWHGELFNLRKDGTEFPVYLSTSVIRDENNNPLALIGVTTDITDRKKAEAELHESETRNKALLSAIPDLMFIFSREGVFTDFHAKNTHMLFMEPELFLGKNIYEVLPPGLAEETMLHLQEVFDTGKTSIFDYNMKIGNDTWAYESRIVPCGEDRALSIVRDITDQKKMESQIIQTERLAALGEMSAGMAHEINQPLNTLSILFDNILFEARENHQVKEDYLVSKSEKIFNNILRIKNLIDHVREFSRSREGFVLMPFDINESIRNALSMVTEQFRLAGIQLDVDLDSALPEVKGNTYKFEQIILNLIINSKDAIIEKKNELNESFAMFISIKTSKTANYIKVEVEDNGIGIKEEHMSKVLQPFYTTKETGKGTGLGLSISYGLIKEMGGNIDIQSRVMNGTSISITIPVKPEK
jgi:PAS domain S-box-containing protein